MNDSDSNGIGPQETSFLTVLLRALAGLGGGLIGTIFVVLIALVASSVLQSALGETASDEVHPLFVFVFMAMIFLGSTAANLLGALLIGLTDRDRYVRLSTALYQVFFVSVMILIVVAPVYMVVAGLKMSMVAAVAALQVIVSGFSSAMTLELLADDRHALVGVYGTALAMIVSSGLMLLLYGLGDGNESTLLFGMLPAAWTSIGLFGGLAQWLYGLIYGWYGTDFLSTALAYGLDERTLSEQEEVELKNERLAERDRVEHDEGAAFMNDSQ